MKIIIKICNEKLKLMKMINNSNINNVTMTNENDSV